MAKRAKINADLFTRTTPEAEAAEPESDYVVPAKGRTVSVGVGLKESEIEALDAIATELGVARNALLRFAVRFFLTQHATGQVNMPVEHVERRKLTMP